MKTTIAISCLLMGASFASLTPTIAHAAEDTDADRALTGNVDSHAEIDKAVVVAPKTEVIPSRTT